jgi:hypothetical protein
MNNTSKLKIKSGFTFFMVLTLITTSFAVTLNKIPEQIDSEDSFATSLENHGAHLYRSIAQITSANLPH